MIKKLIFSFGLYILLIFLCNSQIKTKNITIIAVGDIMLGSTFPTSGNYLPPNDGIHLFDDVKTLFENYDIIFGNLEGCLLDEGGNTNCDDCYSFRMPLKLLQNLTQLGFNVINIANNHANDFGEVGTFSTINALSDAKIAFAGIKNVCEFSIFSKNGVKYGFCGFSTGSVSVMVQDYEKAKQIISKLQQECDVVIVSVHAGGEGVAYNRVTRKNEIFRTWDRGNIFEFAHHCIDWGADIIIGHGPHVPRAIELYNNRLIAYSLGNFCTPFLFNIKGNCGFAPILKVELNNKGEFVEGEIISAIQTDNSGPKIDSLHSAAKEIARLTKLDFPNTQLVITNNGKIIRK